MVNVVFGFRVVRGRENVFTIFLIVDSKVLVVNDLFSVYIIVKKEIKLIRLMVEQGLICRNACNADHYCDFIVGYSFIGKNEIEKI